MKNMDIKFSITLLTQIVQIVILFWGAWYLKKEIHLKDSQIDTLTKNFDEISKMLNLYKANDFKEYMDMKLETRDMKHEKDKAELEKLANFKFSEDNPEFIKAFEQIRSEWTKKQAELIQLLGYFLFQIDKEQREEALSTIPLSRSLIEEFIEKIKKTKK